MNTCLECTIQPKESMVTTKRIKFSKFLSKMINKYHIVGAENMSQFK